MILDSCPLSEAYNINNNKILKEEKKSIDESKEQKNNEQKNNEINSNMNERSPLSIINKFLGVKEYLNDKTDSDHLNTLVKLMKELLLISKIVMFILLLLLLVKILEKKN